MKRVFLCSVVVIGGLFVQPVVGQDVGGAAKGDLEAGLTPRQLTRAALADNAHALETQRQFQDLLRLYSPSLGQALALEPTLLTNHAYVRPYPPLAIFLAQHPEIARHPRFFLAPLSDPFVNKQLGDDPHDAVLRAINWVLVDAMAIIIGLTMIAASAWVTRLR
jgi:hypothetical protein